MVMKTKKEEIDALLRRNIYRSEEEIVDDAIRALLESKPHLKIEIAFYRYKNKEISLWKAAEIAGMTLEEFKDALSSRGAKIESGGSKTESEKRISRVIED